MNKYWRQFSGFVDNKSQRERIIILAVVVVLLYGLFDLLLMGTLLDKNQASSKKLSGLENQLQQMQVEHKQLLQGQQGIADSYGSELKKLQSNLQNLDAELSELTSGFIPADKMPLLLEAMLADTRNLTLKSLANKPVELVAGAEDREANNLYRHGAELKLSGGYVAAMEYLKKLEQLTWRIEWDSLTYEIEEYPNGELTLEIFTYSPEKDWIGV